MKAPLLMLEWVVPTKLQLEPPQEAPGCVPVALYQVNVYGDVPPVTPIGVRVIVCPESIVAVEGLGDPADASAEFAVSVTGLDWTVTPGLPLSVTSSSKL